MNLNKLRGAMAEHRISSSEMSRVLGITPCAFSKKLNGKAEFKVAEIKAMTTVIPDLPILDIFFTDSVTKSGQSFYVELK